MKESAYIIGVIGIYRLLERLLQRAGSGSKEANGVGSRMKDGVQGEVRERNGRCLTMQAKLEKKRWWEDGRAW